MKSYLGYLDPGNQRGKFTPLTLENGIFPITEECIIKFNDQEFCVSEYFGDVPKKHRPKDNGEGVTEHVYMLASHADYDDMLIAIRLIHSPRTTKYIFLNKLSPETEVKFGHLVFRVREEDIHIRDYDPSFIDSGIIKDYNEDLDLTSLTLDILARVGKDVYNKKKLTNTYPYEWEKPERFLSNGFKEVGESINKVWIREI